MLVFRFNYRWTIRFSISSLEEYLYLILDVAFCCCILCSQRMRVVEEYLLCFSVLLIMSEASGVIS